MDNRKVKIGVIGINRGSAMINYCAKASNAELVAICDLNEAGLAKMKERYQDHDITYYTDFDKFLEHDMEVVILANYYHQHVPFALKCFEKGKHVFSEVNVCQCMKEAVELVEAVERSGLTYCYLENYCYFEATAEMRRLYRAGEIGTFEYGEGEYIHDREHFMNHALGNPNSVFHKTWYSTWYCSHAIGPVVHITGLRPVRVTGFETPFGSRHARLGLKTGNAGIEMIEMENGAYLKSYHGHAAATSIWYTLYGAKGRLETERYIPETDYCTKLHLESYAEEGHYDDAKYECYYPTDELSEAAKGFSFSGGDYRMLWNAVEKVKGNPDAEAIDVYEALDICLPGQFAFRSILAGGIPMDIPNLRNKEERDKWRNDTMCTDPAVAGDMLMPQYSKGEIPEIPDSVYENMRKRAAEGKSGLRDGKLARWALTAHLSDDRYKK